MLAPRKLSLAKGEIVASFLLPAKPARIGRRLSALHPAHRDGHRRGRLRRVPDARRQAARARRRASRSAPWRARPLLVAPAAAGADRHQASTTRRWQKLAAAARAACQPIDDKRGTMEYRIKVAGVLARRAAQIALERARKG